MDKLCSCMPVSRLVPVWEHRTILYFIWSSEDFERWKREVIRNTDFKAFFNVFLSKCFCDISNDSRGFGLPLHYMIKLLKITHPYMNIYLMQESPLTYYNVLRIHCSSTYIYLECLYLNLRMYDWLGVK